VKKKKPPPLRSAEIDKALAKGLRKVFSGISPSPDWAACADALILELGGELVIFDQETYKKWQRMLMRSWGH
jgi:hypothetical protein